MVFVALTYFVPWSRYIPGDVVKYKASVESSKWLKNYFQEKIDENRKNAGTHEFHSFAEAYLEEMKKTKSDMDSQKMGKRTCVLIR